MCVYSSIIFLSLSSLSVVGIKKIFRPPSAQNSMDRSHHPLSATEVGTLHIIWLHIMLLLLLTMLLLLLLLLVMMLL